MIRLPASGVILILLCCLNVLPAPAKGHEGYYTEEEIRTPAPGGGPDVVLIRKSWYCGSMMRKEEGWLGTTIARFDRDSIYVLDDPSKTFFAITPKFVRANAEAALEIFGALRDRHGELYFPDDLFVRTETTKKICLWDSYQVMTNPKYRGEDRPYVVMYFSTEVDFPVQLYGEQLKSFLGTSPVVEGLFNLLKKFEGYPVRTETHDGSNFSITTLLKIEYRKNLESALFETPRGYSLVPLPEVTPPPRREK